MTRRKRKPEVYERWKDVPKTFATRNGWKERGRKVNADEQATAFLEIVEERKLTTINATSKTYKQIALFHLNQTHQFNASPLERAKQRYYRVFVKPANRSKLIKWCKGSYVDDSSGERYWDSTIPDEGWLKHSECLTLSRVESHLSGREEYGIFGGENSYHLMIDVDLHKVPYALFLRRLEVLLDHFHGDCRCHFQVAEKDARGVHMILFFGNRSPLKTRRRWLKKEFQKLERIHSDIYLTADTIKSLPDDQRKLVRPVEVFPDVSHGHRLPLAKGRLLLLDKPLYLICRRKKLRQDVEGYLNWLANRECQYMSKDAVLSFVLERLDMTCAAEHCGSGLVLGGDGDGERLAEHVPNKKKPRKASTLRGRTRGALVNLWSKSELGPFEHFNAGVLVTLRGLQAQGVSEEDAVEIVMRFVDELPDTTICSRLSGKRNLVDADICRDARKVWKSDPSYTWQAAASHWEKIGFQLSDKTTWDARREPPPPVFPSDVEITFTVEEKQLLTEKLAPIVFGNKLSRKPEKQERLFQAMAYFLRYVKGCDRELPETALPLVLVDFSLKLRNHDKQAAFFRCLRETEWLYVAMEYDHPQKKGGGQTHRARRYGIGKAVAYKFGDPAPVFPSSLPPQQYELYSVSRFLGGRPEIGENPQF